MNQRLFHVGLSVPEHKLWDLLSACEILGAGDIEIRHIPETANKPVQLDSTTVLALPNVQQDLQARSMKGHNLRLVLSVMPSDGSVTSPRSLAGPTGLTPKQVAMALYVLLQKKLVKRVALGDYVRVG